MKRSSTTTESIGGSHSSRLAADRVKIRRLTSGVVDRISQRLLSSLEHHTSCHNACNPRDEPHSPTGSISPPMASRKDDESFEHSPVLAASQSIPTTHATVDDITITLDDGDLWQSFNECGTEMIINRPGRRMFPAVCTSIQGLDPKASYRLAMELIPADDRRYKFVNNKWVAVGKSDPEIQNSAYVHPDSVSKGSAWMQTKVSFAKIKITNSRDSAEGNILLHSMHKYMAQVHIYRFIGGDVDKHTVIPLPLTSFIAVTAYQSEMITQMKIRNNPFAKAFRDSDFNGLGQPRDQHNHRHVIPSREQCILQNPANIKDEARQSQYVLRPPQMSAAPYPGLPLSGLPGVYGVPDTHVPHPAAWGTHFPYGMSTASISPSSMAMAIPGSTPNRYYFPSSPYCSPMLPPALDMNARWMALRAGYPMDDLSRLRAQNVSAQSYGWDLRGLPGVLSSPLGSPIGGLRMHLAANDGRSITPELQSRKSPNLTSLGHQTCTEGLDLSKRPVTNS